MSAFLELCISTTHMVDDPEKNTLKTWAVNECMQDTHEERKTFNESKILSLVNGRMVAATRKSETEMLEEKSDTNEFKVMSV